MKRGLKDWLNFKLWFRNLFLDEKRIERLCNSFLQIQCNSLHLDEKRIESELNFISAAFGNVSNSMKRGLKVSWVLKPYF